MQLHTLKSTFETLSLGLTERSGGVSSNVAVSRNGGD